MHLIQLYKTLLRYAAAHNMSVQDVLDQLDQQTIHGFNRRVIVTAEDVSRFDRVIEVGPSGDAITPEESP
jgi:hypothetical protein